MLTASCDMENLRHLLFTLMSSLLDDRQFYMAWQLTKILKPDGSQQTTGTHCYGGLMDSFDKFDTTALHSRASAW